MSGASQINPNELELAIWRVIWDRAQDLGRTRADIGAAIGKTGQQVGRYIAGTRVAPLTQVEDAARFVGLTLLGVIRDAEKLRDSREAAAGTPPTQDEFTMAARQPGPEYAKGNPDVELNELDLP